MQWSVDEEEEKLNSVFYNELVSSYRLIDRSKLGALSFTFWCDENMDDGSKIEQTFGRNAFQSVPAKTGLYKMAARILVKGSDDSTEREAISLKYQVLAPETAFVGVVKEDGKI